MQTENYITHLKAKLDEMDRQITLAASRLETSNVAGKARALDDLAHLRIRRDELGKQIEKAQEKGASDWGALRMSMQEEADAIKDALEGWLTRLN